MTCRPRARPENLAVTAYPPHLWRGKLRLEGDPSAKQGDVMSLNVKDPEARRLAQAIADATGQSMSRVVTEALRERYARLRLPSAKASVEELLAIADHAAAHVKRPYLEHGDLLYDERGLPK